MKLALSQALSGIEIPENIKNSLAIIDVPFFSFAGKEEIGQMVVSRKLTDEVLEIFKIICAAKFPIGKIKPVSLYHWSDEESMQNNNASAFNYRKIYGTDRLSSHSFGSAIDINPALNPYIPKDGSIHPVGAVYDTEKPGTIISSGIVVKTFERFGWQWGGNWQNVKDYQHFEKIGFDFAQA